jgi:hypothetical protein
MSLFDLRPIEPEPVITAPDPKQEYALRVKQTKSGREIMVYTAAIAPADVIAEAEARGLALFTGPEILLMRDCVPKMVDHIISVKTTFPGCTVQQIINEAVAE